MSVQIAIRIPNEDVAALDAMIARGAFPTRAAAVREALVRLLQREAQREIDEAYRRGYGIHPQEKWVGDVGLAAFASLVEAEEAGEEPL